jgi:hypothetical protein
MTTFKLLILFVIVLAFSCKKEHGDEYVTLYYKQTYCSDPWPTANTDSVTLLNIAHYLDSADMYVASLNIKLESAPEACTACSCKTGKTIYATTLNSDVLKDKYVAVGFKLN